MTPRLVNLLTVAGLTALLVLVSTTAPRWAVFLRRPIESQNGESTASQPEPATRASPPRSGEAQRTISVKLFFEAADRRGLVSEDRTVTFSSDLPRQIQVVVGELVTGSRNNLMAPLNPATRVLEVFLSARGVAYVDLSKEARESDLGGTEAERLAVYSIVNTIVENFPAVRRVQILIEDRPAETLAGHIDLSRPLSADLTLLADLQPPLPAERAPSPPATPGPVS